MLLGPALGGVRHPDVDMWMAAKGATGAAALLDFAGQKYGLRNAAGVPRWGSVAADTVFARASAAGRWPASGPYEMVGSGALRYDHDPVTRQPLGVRIEGAATNLLTNSEFPNGIADVWSMAGDVTAVSDIEGGRTGLHFDNTSGNARAYKLSTNATPGSTYTISGYVEMEDGSAPSFAIPSTSPTSGANTFAFVIGGTGYTPEIVERVGAKVWRVSRSAIAGTSGVSGVFQYQTNQQRRIKVTGFQLEAGAVASSYIVTGASAVTRAAERLYRSLSSDPAVDGVTAAIRARTPQATTGARVLYTITQTSLVNRYVLYFQNGLWYLGYGRNGALQMLLSAPANPGADVRMAISVTSTGTFKWCINGGSVTTSSQPAPLQGVMTSEYIGCYPTGTEYYSTIEHIARWRGTPHSDADLQGLLA